MSDFDNDPIMETPDEMTALKVRADRLGIKYHPSISLDKLREKVNAAATDTVAPASKVEAEPVVPHVETPGERRTRKKREANELIRVRVTCMNPAKAEWDGEFFTAGNSLVGSFTKFVPFNVDEGWHIPRIIYDQLTDRQCQIFTSIRDNRGNSVRKGKLIKEFAIEVMPSLTADELHDLAQRQAVAKAID